MLGFAGFHSVRTRLAYGVTIAVTLHPSPERDSPLRLKLVYFHYSTQHVFKDVEIKSQHRLRMLKTVIKKKKKHNFVHQHVIVPIIIHLGTAYSKNMSIIVEEMDHGE